MFERKEMINAWALLGNIKDYEKKQSIENRLHQQGGWRAFFDPMSHQWSMTTVEQKIAFLYEIVEGTGTNLSEIIDLYKKDYGADRPDIATRIESALEILLDCALRREVSKEV
jgi:hypothetical protein